MLQLQPTTTQHPHKKKTTHLAKAIIKKQKTTLKKQKTRTKTRKTSKNKNKNSNTNKTKNQKTKKIEILINVGYELIFGPVIIGMVVGYYRGNKFIDGFLNAFFAGCIGGLILGVLLYIVYLLAPYTDSYPGDLVVSPLVVLITGLFGMAVIFSFLSAVGGILGSLIKKLRGSNRYNEEDKNG